jgi:hypothetical protein
MNAANLTSHFVEALDFAEEHRPNMALTVDTSPAQTEVAVLEL